MGRNKGYTMIELIVVIALFSIISAIATPSFNMVKNYKELHELKEFKRDVLLARNQAIVTNKTHDFNLDYSTNSYFIVAEGKTIKRVYFIQGIRLIEDPLKVISFGRTGVPSKGGTIKLITRNNKRYYLKIRPVVGKITLTDILD